MPQLVYCDKCKVYEKEIMNFVIGKGKIYCNDCISNNDSFISINSSLLTSLRHIVYSPIEKIFKFKVLPETARNLSIITEKYVKMHVCESFKSLEFFNLF